MDPQSSSSASSSMSRRNFGAFLSFRGVDTRLIFISHLYRALREKGVYTFKDNEELEAGQKRSELFDAIEGSRVAVVTFSENYARSKWCLDELQKIMERKGQGKLTVIPIFYHVSPREVRLHEKENGEKGCYQIAMEEMVAKYDSETVERWGKALWEGGDLIGVPVVLGQDEGDVVQDVVKRVMKMLNPVTLEAAKHPVGIDRHLTKIRRSLRIDPHIDDVCIVGLLGPGGAGKTTLSKAIYNDIADRFDNWCFLPNVRETTSRFVNGLAQLQQELLQELLSDKDLKVLSVDKGKTLIKERLGEKRVLVILDDIEESIQLDALAGDLNWFGKGSRIILTTRNEHVLTANKVPKYEVNLLEREEADNLFRCHAFGTQDKINIDCSLIDRFVEYAGELPLALVVLGAFLRGRSKSEWEGKLKELKESPDEAINTVLKISYDGLEKKHKEIFLDVACLFKGRNMDNVGKILDGCNFAESPGLTILRERGLITIVDKRIEMHDLLVEMGQSISRDNGHGIPSRIRLYKDFWKILSDERSVQERQAVEGIVLYVGSENDDCLVKFNVLRDFKKLRILIVQAFVRTEELLQLPRELRWLEWRRSSTPVMEFYQSSELVHLDLEFSKIQQLKATGLEKLKYLNLYGCTSIEMLPDLSRCSDLEELNLSYCNSLTRFQQTKAMGLKKLKYLNLSYCSSLKTLPDLSRCRDLEDLNLSYCDSLTRVDEAIGSLKNLVHLNLSDCRNLATVPSLLRSERLQTLDLRRCFNVKKVPAMEKNEFVKELTLTFTAVKELPDSIGNLVALKELSLSCCMELTVIPSSIYKMRDLQVLKLERCWKLSGFPRRVAGTATDVYGLQNLKSLMITYCKLKDLEFLDDLTCFKTLTLLNLSGNEFTHVPASISKFMNLRLLKLNNCDQLMKVPELPNVPYLNLSNSHSLDSGNINRLLSLENVRGSVGVMGVIFPGEEFPHWVKLRFGECNSCYRVSFSQEMLEDDIFGLALFISFGHVDPSSLNESICGCVFSVWVNRVCIFWHPRGEVVGVHSWCVYIPCQSLVQRDGVLASKLNRLDITLEISGDGVELRRWGMRLLCKREEEDDLIKVLQDGDENDDPSGWESLSGMPIRRLQLRMPIQRL